MSDAEAQTVTKKELVNRISEETGHTKVVVKEIVQRFLDEIIAELAEGHRLEFREFGVFEVKVRAARMAQNPRTLEKVHVPAKRVVKFKVGRAMRERVVEEAPPRPRQTPPPEPPPRPQPPKPPPSNSPF
jgi:integration host factor subunit beta